jgi:excisionase family DNA binding protein
VATIRKRIEIIAIERERVVVRAAMTACPVCRFDTELLTTEQAGALAKVKAQSIRRWLAQGKAHGVRTVGGHYLICRNSLFVVVGFSSSTATNGTFQ